MVQGMKALRNALGGWLTAFVLATVCGCGQAVTAPARAAHLQLVKVGTFDEPTYVTSPPDDPSRLFVVEKRGRVRVLIRGRLLRQPFLNLSKVVNSSAEEQGLLSVAFAPDYARSRRFYVDFTDHTGDVRVVELQRTANNPNLASPRSARNVLTIDHRRFTNHNGGQLEFGPDGYLYVGVGDGGSEDDPFNYGQNKDVLLAKILRIDPRPAGGYSIPASNPFRDDRPAQPATWAYGLRNPWRFSFDRQTGDLVIADVGQDQEEEVDFAPRGTGAGANYGWSIWEGYRRNKPGRAPGAVFPVLVTLHSHGYCAIIGGYVVRDRSLKSLYGRYIYGDLCKPEIQAAKLRRGHASDKTGTGLDVAEMSSFGEDASGRVYAVSLKGPVYRIESR